MGTQVAGRTPIRDCGFPLDASRREQIRFLLHYATRAPSGHNTQPWRFRIDGRGVDVLAERSRALAVVDPHDRELTISCGAAIGMLEAAARRFSLDAQVTSCTDAADADCLARVVLDDGAPAAGDESARFDALRVRRTRRVAYESKPVPAALIAECREAASACRVDMLAIDGDDTRKGAVAELVAEGDRRQFGDPRFRRELAAWIRSRRRARRDGMSAAAFGMHDVLSPAFGAMIRCFDLGARIAAVDATKIRAGSPLLAVLATERDVRDAWIDTGRALSAVLLRLTVRGFSASYLNQPIEVDALRQELRALLGVAGHPQMLLRIGRCDGDAAPSARRPLCDVVVG